MYYWFKMMIKSYIFFLVEIDLYKNKIKWICFLKDKEDREGIVLFFYFFG